MLLGRFFLILFIMLSLSIISFAQADLVQIDYSIIGDNKYRVTFALNKQVSYNVVPSENKISIDFTNTEFAVEPISKKLDGRFLKTIMKLGNEPNNLKIIVELSDNTKFNKTYSVAHDGKLFVTIEVSNNNLIITNKPIKKKDPSKKIIIMIDPGHGGIDKGAIGSYHNSFEKDISLAYAKELRKELKKYTQYQVIMTRDEDTYISSEARGEAAKNKKVDLFISLHADSNSDHSLRGASIYTLSQEGMEREASVLSERENKSNILKNDKLLKQNKNIANVLINMVYQNTHNASINLAKITTEALSKTVEMLQKPHRAAELKVLKGVDTPAILVELGYLSNDEEEKLLGTTKHKKLLIQGLVQGINKYVDSLK